jgi:hypothetical protein
VTLNRCQFLVTAVLAIAPALALAKGGLGELFGAFIGKGIGNAVGKSFADPRTVEGALRQMAEEVNTKTPTRVDADTRLDNLSTGPGARFTYNYTITSGASTEIDPAALMTHLRTKVRPGVCTSPDMQIFFKNKVTVGYSYRGRDGVFLAKLDVRPEDCTINQGAAQSSTEPERVVTAAAVASVDAAAQSIVGTWKCERTISTYFSDGTVEESFMSNPKTLRRWKVLPGTPNLRLIHSPYHDSSGEPWELEIRRQSSSAMALVSPTGSLIECSRLRGKPTATTKR